MKTLGALLVVTALLAFFAGRAIAAGGDLDGQTFNETPAFELYLPGAQDHVMPIAAENNEWDQIKPVRLDIERGEIATETPGK